MPLIMDDDQAYNSMDVDDLFGDSEPVALPILNAIRPPPVKGLARRLDELSTSGCCSKMAWSKNGCVAYITPDGRAVNVRVFSRDPSTGKWDLGKDNPIDIPHGHDEFPFVHISWSHLGTDLAVMDAAGHVMVFSCTMAIDRMSFVRTDLAQPEADIDAAVGMHWLALLPYEQKNHIAWSASRKGDGWKFNMTSHVFRDMHHPVEQKASMIYLKRQGDLRLRFQQPDSSWQEVTASLGPLMSTKEAFTHAAFASNNDNTLLLAAYDASSRLHLYRINAQWSIPPQKPGQQPPKHYEKPELHISQIAVEDHCYPTLVINDLNNVNERPTIVSSDLNSASESRLKVPAQLTHLNFLPVTPEQDDGTYPTIQTIFTTPPNSAPVDQTHPPQNPCSVIVKWEVHYIQQNQLHPSLDKVTSKKKSVSSVPARSMWLLKRQEDMKMHSVILSFYPLWYNMLLAYCYSDGSIEFRKRSTMDIITSDYNTDTVSSLPQAGFAFPTLEPSLHIALSPSYCVAACMQQDGTIKLRSMEYTNGSLATDEDHPRHSAALTALILQSITALNQYFCNDDIFSTMGELSEKRKRDFVQLMFEGLAVNIDCGVDDQNTNHLILLGRTPFFVKTLSAVHLLGLQGSVNRSLSSKAAWTILNIKYVTQILTTVARMHGQIDKNPLRPEVVPQIIGICRWIMHFMVYMIDELLETGRALSALNGNLTGEIIEAKIHELNKPALLILLSSFPRTLMKLWAQPIQWVLRTTYTYVGGSGSHPPELRRVFYPLHQAMTETPLDWRHFEGLVSEAQSLVRHCYKHAGWDEKTEVGRRNLCERELILGHIPDVLVPAAKRLISDSLFNDAMPNGCLAARVDMAKIMFFDTTWLGFASSQHATKWFATHVVDVCQKMVIRGTGAQSHPTGGVTAPQGRSRSDSLQSAGGPNAGDERKKKERRLRRCVRCGAYTEDVTMGLPGYANHHVSWLMGVGKHCVCGHNWMLAAEKEQAR